MERPSQMVIRYLSHSGEILYYHGTDNAGITLFSSIEDARFFDRVSGQRIMALCLSQDFDVELVTYLDSMRVVV